MRVMPRPLNPRALVLSIFLLNGLACQIGNKSDPPQEGTPRPGYAEWSFTIDSKPQGATVATNVVTDDTFKNFRWQVVGTTPCSMRWITRIGSRDPVKVSYGEVDLLIQPSKDELYLFVDFTVNPPKVSGASIMDK